MIARVLATAIGLMGGLAASQAPEFAQQYRQRLGGAVDELRRVVGRFDETARGSGLSRDAAMARLGAEADPLVRGQADDMRQTVARLDRLERQRREIAEAGPFSRILVTVRDADPDLARATYLDFEPAWPATAEGLATGATGFLLGWLGILFGSRVARRLVPRRRRQRVRAGDLRSA